MERKHFEVAVVFLTGILLIVVMYFIQGFTGASVDNTGMYEQSSISISKLNANVMGEEVNFQVDIENKLEYTREVEVNYEFFNAKGDKFGEGSQKVIIGADKEQEYKFSFNLNGKEVSGSLGVEVYDSSNQERDYASIPLEIYSITGNAIADSGKGKINVILIWVIFIFGLFTLFSFIMKRHREKHNLEIAREIHDRGKIKLR